MDTKTERNAPESLFEKIKNNNDSISSHSSRSSFNHSGNQSTRFVQKGGLLRKKVQHGKIDLSFNDSGDE